MREHEQNEHDERLALFSDALLSGRSASVAARPPMAEVVETLSGLLQPQPPPAALRRAVRQRVAREWQREFPPPHVRWLRGLQTRNGRRVAAMAALAALAIVVAVLLPRDPIPLSGSALGGPWMIALAIVTVLLAVLGWRLSR